MQSGEDEVEQETQRRLRFWRHAQDWLEAEHAKKSAPTPRILNDATTLLPIADQSVH